MLLHLLYQAILAQAILAQVIDVKSPRLPVARGSFRSMAIMATRLPLGFSDSDGPETATVSRERRRVALAARSVVQELVGPLMSQIEVLTTKATEPGRFDRIESKVDGILACLSDIAPRELLAERIGRLEALYACSSASVDHSMSPKTTDDIDTNGIHKYSPAISVDSFTQGEPLGVEHFDLHADDDDDDEVSSRGKPLAVLEASVALIERVFIFWPTDASSALPGPKFVDQPPDTYEKMIGKRSLKVNFSDASTAPPEDDGHDNQEEQVELDEKEAVVEEAMVAETMPKRSLGIGEQAKIGRAWITDVLDFGDKKAKGRFLNNEIAVVVDGPYPSPYDAKNLKLGRIKVRISSSGLVGWINVSEMGAPPD